MIHLDSNSPNVKKAKDNFLKNLKPLIIKRKGKYYENNIIHDKLHNFWNWLEGRIDNLLIDKPSKLKELIVYFNYLKTEDTECFVKYIFDYDYFIRPCKKRYGAYSLAMDLDIRTCPYCNRNYTITAFKKKGKAGTRPQFDHYFDKSRHPLLALSFYNLIPSCSICNSNLKGKGIMDLAKHIHPYLDNCIDDFQFTYKLTDKSKSGLEVEVKHNGNARLMNALKLFAIEEVYNAHTSELGDLLKLREYYSDKYLSILQEKIFSTKQVSTQEMYRILFGVEYDSKDFVNRPLSKFKRDILKELGIIVSLRQTASCG